MEHYLDAYLAAGGVAGAAGTPLFSSLDSRGRLTGRRLDAREALAMIKRRARQAGLGDGVSWHTFRATGMTNYLEHGGTVDVDQPYCLH